MNDSLLNGSHVGSTDSLIATSGVEGLGNTFSSAREESLDQATRRSKHTLWILAGTLLGLVAIYWSTALSMFEIWWRSETFAHGIFVLPISLWLIWRERLRLINMTPQPTVLPLVFLGVAGVGWLFSELASVNSPTQFALVLMLQFSVWALIGTRMALTLLFPLLFLFFAVPAGEFLLPTLMHWTADFTVQALRLTGIPVYKEGLDFVIPSGKWSVVEACSGIRYLIASLMVGALYAYLTYHSWKRRLCFLSFAALVPIVANWLRAYIIVMIGHLSDNRLAKGVDHLIYGWLFFGVVMLAMFWIGAYWREDTTVQPENAAPAATPSSHRYSMIAMAVLVLVVGGLWRPLAMTLESVGAGKHVQILSISETKGWVAEPQLPADWRPVFLHPRATLEMGFSKDGHHVGMVMSYYKAQNQDSELVNSENKLVDRADLTWRQRSDSTLTVSAPQSLTVRVADLASPNQRLRVWMWYWVDGKLTSSDFQAKLLQARSKIMGRGDDSAAIVIFTPIQESTESADTVLTQFVGDLGGTLTATLSKTAERTR